MKVFALYKCEMLMPYWVETLLELYKHEDDAVKEAKYYNDSNSSPLESDSYGPISGCRYEVKTLYVK